MRRDSRSWRAARIRRVVSAATVVLITCSPVGFTLLSLEGAGRRAATSLPSHLRSTAPSVSEWLAAGTPEGDHFAPLLDISPANVHQLRPAWVYRTGDVASAGGDTSATSFQATPIMVEGTLYFSTPFNRVIALDAETGRERWTFDPAVDRSSRLRKYVTSRGVATWLDTTRRVGDRCRRRIILATIDARLIQLDAQDGRPCREFGRAGVIELRAGVRNIRREVLDYRQTAPPTVIRDVIVIGSSITDNWRVEAPSGVVRGFDARTGRLLWSWEPLLDVGVGPERIRAGAANAWAMFSVDTARGLVFVPTSSASPDHYGAYRPGDNRHANSVVALDAFTGRFVWSFQLVHHDLWDYDIAAQPALAQTTRNGERIPLIIAASKVGHLFFLRRDDGTPYFKIHERVVARSDVPGEVTSPTQPFPSRPRPLAPHVLRPGDAWGLTPIDRTWCRDRIAALRSEGLFTPPSVRGTITFPGFIGGMAWGGMAVDNARGVLVTTTNRLAGVVTLIPKARAQASSTSQIQLNAVGAQEGAPYAVQRELLLSPLGLPCNKPPWGTIVAIEIATGEVKWEVPLGSMSDLTQLADATEWGSIALGGPLITASGLVFVGASMDRRLRAFDTSSGRMLWSAALPASAQATPMTYRASRGGRQYIVIAAGGHAVMGSALGDYLIAFALP
jgi:quinoprotein glucose dehydrogenase